MSPHLALYLTNNESPPESVLHEISKAMQGTMEELSRSKAEIERIESYLQELKRTHDGIKISLDPYYIVLSPIRRVPPDILREIFFHCLPTRRNSIMSSAEAPVSLTHICRTWREIALSSPQIWARLHIPFSEMAPSPNILLTQPDDHPALRHARVMDQRCKVVAEWLSRSGNCPLSISLHCPHRSTGHRLFTANQFMEYSETAAQRVLNIILPLAKRWKDLQLSIPSDVYEKIQAEISPDMIPMLQTLKVNAIQQFEPSRFQEPAVLLQAPNLQRLSISSFDILNLKNMAILQKLTSLSWHSSFSNTEILGLLRKLPNLVHFKGFLVNAEEGNQVLESITVSLPALQSLCVVDGGNLDVTEKIYGCINAPHLKWIDYRRHPFYRDTNPNYEFIGIPLPVLPLLKKTVGVKKLTLEQKGLRTEDIIRSFHLVPSLSHLVIGDDTLHVTRLDRFQAVNKSQSENFDLNLLIVDEQSSREEILLPGLLAFQAHWVCDITDETLLRFIKSRLNPASKNGVSVLKFVHVTFSRARQGDISEEVYRCAKAAGVELKLDLVYQPIKREKYLDPLSSSCGLTGDGQSTWHHRDVEDSEVMFY